MNDNELKERVKFLVNQINTDCVVGGGTNGMYLDGDAMFVLIYNTMQDFTRQLTPENIYLGCDSTDQPLEFEEVEEATARRRGRQPGTKNKVIE